MSSFFGCELKHLETVPVKVICFSLHGSLSSLSSRKVIEHGHLRPFHLMCPTCPTLRRECFVLGFSLHAVNRLIYLHSTGNVGLFKHSQSMRDD